MPPSTGVPAREQGAGELVERIVPADIFAHGDQSGLRAPKCRGMHGARLPVQLLPGRQRIERPHDLGRRKDGPVAHAPRRPHGLVEAFDAAEPAAGRAGEMPPPLAQGRRARLGEPHAQFDAGLVLDDLELADIRRRSDKAFGEAEAERKILEVLRRRHHHRIGAALIGEGDGGLLGDDALAVGRALAAPDRALDGHRRLAHAATPRPRPSPRCAGSCARVRRIAPATPSGRSTATPGPRSPCIRGSWSPSRNTRW